MLLKMSIIIFIFFFLQVTLLYFAIRKRFILYMYDLPTRSPFFFEGHIRRKFQYCFSTVSVLKTTQISSSHTTFSLKLHSFKESSYEIKFVTGNINFNPRNTNFEAWEGDSSENSKSILFYIAFCSSAKQS